MYRNVYIVAIGMILLGPNHGENPNLRAMMTWYHLICKPVCRVVLNFFLAS